ncbi:MAG: polyprenyl synthetase family protein [Clostridia bacterium]|nr:polyprenyl synthetase family protein [Clostridia bacterium]
MTDIKELLSEDAKLAENVLEEYLSAKRIGSGRLQEAMRYSVLGGGKRIRAALVFEFCKAFGGTVSSAEPFAAAIEMIHAYSLIHDDLPCMDDDDMRRGKPSCHAAYGEATALLAGDTLLTYAFEVASSARLSSDKCARLATASLAYNAGSLGMAGGQMFDLENAADSYEKLKKLHSMKTSALIKASSYCGYLCAVSGPDEKVLSAISDYSEALGLAFQIKDDLLDLEGDASLLGKKVGVDEKNGRVNSLSFLSPDEARAECEKLAKFASDAISGYDDIGFLTGLPAFLNSRNK